MNPNSITTIKIRCCEDTVTGQENGKGSGCVSGQFLLPRSHGILVRVRKNKPKLFFNDHCIKITGRHNHNVHSK